ncbi:catabolic L-serine/threonine dehydratase [Marasmius crinis-equi]|uniref:L-serine ammonia-lyase n=1 Tax=Marasmius crinis-equi TaxID=585013 RepID=A0ABR3FZC8_9AGAR
MSSPSLWNNTPLIYSSHLSKTSGCSVYLKLEVSQSRFLTANRALIMIAAIVQNLQPSHSFKSRGIGFFIQKVKEERGPGVHLIIASGGNAGYAAACAARILGVKCTVYIPEGVAKSTLDLLNAQDAEVVVTGKFYLEALNAAQDTVDRESNAVMVPAYDNAIVWEGHSFMIDEVSSQLGKKPDAIFCSVGGGGLLGGIIVGCKKVGWDDVPIVALETLGSNCFHHSVLMNTTSSSQFATTLPPSVTKELDSTHDLKLAHFHGFFSRASGSLGASRPSAGVVKMALERKGGIQCVSVQDELSMQAGVLFAEEHKMLVELACSTTLVPAYKSQLMNKLLPQRPDRTVVFIVCGGFKVSLSEMEETRALLEAQLARKSDEGWEVVCGDGDSLRLDYSVS